MISKASVTFVRISPRKVRYVIDLIRKKKVREAQAILSGSPRRASEIIRKLLDQALDAAKRNSNVDSTDLMISKILADGGPSMRRFRAASMGRASLIKKRTSHITLELDMLKNRVASVNKPAAQPAGAKAQPPAAAPQKKAGRVQSAVKKMVGAK